MIINHYFAGEIDADILKRMLDRGYNIGGIYLNYLDYNFKNIIELKPQYKFGLLIDMGAEWFRNVKKKSNPAARDTKVWNIIKSHTYDEYVKEVIEWMKNNKEKYDYVIELHINEIVGDEKVEEWRKWFIENGLIERVIFVFDFIKDELAVLDKWKELGLKYIAVSNFKFEDVETARWKELIAKARMNLFKVHVFGIGINKEFELKGIHSVESISWLSAGKYHILEVYKDGELNTYKIEDEKPLYRNISKSKFMIEIFSEKELSEARIHGYKIYNYWNMWQEKLYVDYKNSKLKTKEDVIEMLQRDNALPAVVDDKFIKSLGRRYGNYKHGIYAKTAHEFALTCGNCPVKEKCQFRGSDNDVCYFTLYWHGFSMRVRDKAEVINKLENMIAEDYEEFLRNKYFSKLTGGEVNTKLLKLEDMILKEMDLLMKLKYGQGINQLNVISLGNTAVLAGSLDAELEKVRREFGDEIAEKVMNKIKKKEKEIDAEYEEVKENGNE